MAEQNFMQEYSQLDRDVIKFTDNRLQELNLEEVPREAFKDPAVLVNSFMDDAFREDVVLFKEMDDPFVLNQYLYDNAEEICTVLDTMAEKKDFTVEDIVENPKQVIFDVYAEEATQLIAQTPFYTNQGMCEENANNKLNEEDLAVIRSCINNEPLHLRNENVIYFEGIDDGKPYVAEFEYKNALIAIDELLKEDFQKDANMTSHRIIDRTANDFRVQGPTESMRDFNLQFEYLAKDYEKQPDEKLKSIADTVRTYAQEQSKLFFHTSREGGFGFEPKQKDRERVDLRVRDREDKEQTMERRR